MSVQRVDAKTKKRRVFTKSGNTERSWGRTEHCLIHRWWEYKNRRSWRRASSQLQNPCRRDHLATQSGLHELLIRANQISHRDRRERCIGKVPGFQCRFRLTYSFCNIREWLDLHFIIQYTSRSNSTPIDIATRISNNPRAISSQYGLWVLNNLEPLLELQ